MSASSCVLRGNPNVHSLHRGPPQALYFVSVAMGEMSALIHAYTLPMSLWSEAQLTGTLTTQGITVTLSFITAFPFGIV